MSSVAWVALECGVLARMQREWRGRQASGTWGCWLTWRHGRGKAHARLDFSFSVLNITVL